MTKERYIVTLESMLDLPLNASELLAYSLIWGFCQDGESDFHGSEAYVARWCRVTPRQARAILRKLTDEGYIIKAAYPGKENHYTIANMEGGRNFPPEEISAHPGNNFRSTPEEISADNKEDNKRDNKDTQSLPRTREDLNAYGEFVRMSAENYARLVTRFGADDAARLCEILDAYLAKKPNAYRDHYRAALGWPVQRLQEEKLNQQRLKNAQEAGQRVNGQQQPYSGYGEYGLAASKRLEELLKQN